MTNSRIRGLLVGTHVALAVVLVAMAVPQVPKIPEQFASGYVPDFYPLFIALTVAPFVAAATILALLLLWVRRGIRWPLILADAATGWLAWSVFVIYVFDTDLALVQFALAPVCLVVAVLVAFTERRRVEHA